MKIGGERGRGKALDTAILSPSRRFSRFGGCRRELEKRREEKLAQEREDAMEKDGRVARKEKAVRNRVDLLFHSSGSRVHSRTRRLANREKKKESRMKITLALLRILLASL